MRRSLPHCAGRAKTLTETGVVRTFSSRMSEKRAIGLHLGAPL